MNRMMMDSMLVLGIVIGIMSQGTSAKIGGFIQTSYFSTNGDMAKGAAESSVTGSDGIKKGQCSFTNGQGEYLTIKYEETSNGQVTGEVTGDKQGAAIKNVLAECRSSLSTFREDINHGIQEGNEQFEHNFQDQMAKFNRQQEAFNQQQTDFFQQMEEFNKRFLNW